MEEFNFKINPTTDSVTEKEQYIESVFNSNNILKFSNTKFLDQIALLIDFSYDLRRLDGLDYAITKLEPFLERKLYDHDRALGYYYLANAYSNKKNLKVNMNDVLSKWDNPEIERETLHYRLALKYLHPIWMKNKSNSKKTEEEIFHNNIRYCQINTNLGNVMDSIGRFVEAIDYRKNALSLNPKFGMALGGLGLSYLWYARFLYDTGHQSIFSIKAYHLLKSSLECELEYGANGQFQKGINYIQSHIKNKSYLEKDLDLSSFPIGDTDEEKKYRTWCLQNALFLNPLNDLGPYPIAAGDVLSIPTIVTSLFEGPNCQILFNQLKQEFITARYRYYQGIIANTVHFSDKEVFLFDTEDYPVYSKASEDIKITFRLCYSILDKIAFFLNYYLKLGINEKDVYFKKIWFSQKRINGESKRPKRKVLQLRDNLTQKNNLPLLGLFWISKDLFEEDIRFKDALEPDAKEWYQIRNHLEHKFLKLQLFNDESYHHSNLFFGEINKSLTYSLGIHDFERKTLKLIKTVRAALIYLVLAMQYEEFERKQLKEKEIKSISIKLNRFPDDKKTRNYQHD